MKNISLITLNHPGLESAKLTLKDLLAINTDFNIKVYHKSDIDCENFIKYNNIDEILENIWKTSDAIIWFAATGIAVRKIVPFLDSKIKDPAVLVINMQRTQIMPLISGHIGGANELAEKLAKVNRNLTPFITTATDSLNVLAFDMFAKKMGYQIVNINDLARVSNSLINNKSINLVTYPVIWDLIKAEGLSLNNIQFYDIQDSLESLSKDNPTVIISPYNEFSEISNALKIKIQPISLGIGLNRNTSLEELEADLNNFLAENDLSIDNILAFASFDAKKDELALIQLADKYKKTLEFYNENDINHLKGEFSSSKAQEYFNIKGVAEPTAVLAAPMKTLFVKKRIYKNTTIAAAF